MAFLVQLGLALLAVVVFRRGVGICNPHTVTVLPDGALIALDEKTVSVGLGVIVTALVLLVTANAARDFVFLTVVHAVFSYAVGIGVCVVLFVVSGKAGARVSVVGAVPSVTTARRRSR